jgi:hypothetical protein
MLSARSAVGNLYFSAISRTSDLSKSPMGNRVWLRVSKGRILESVAPFEVRLPRY